jgi:hypothetical protein
MSRADYSDDCDGWALICWRGAVASALRGKRGQQALRELAAAMDAMPVKRLIAHELVRDGEYCTLGVLGAAKSIPMDYLDPYNADDIAERFQLSRAMVREIEYMNDEYGWNAEKETPEQRWLRMREWVREQIKEAGRTT